MKRRSLIFVTAAALVGVSACAPAPTARDRLLSAAEAIGSLGSVSYDFTYEGSGSAAGRYEGSVRLIPRTGAPLYRAEIRPSPSWSPSDTPRQPGQEPPALILASGGDFVAARDEALGRLSYGTISGGSGHLVANAPYAVLFELTATNPFEAALAGPLTFEEQQTVGGILCDVIRGTSSEFGAADVWWYIAVEDDLPRAYRWAATAEGAGSELYFEIHDLDIEQELTTQSLEISQQQGDDAVDEDARPIEPGAPAPDWTLSGPGQMRVRLSDLRGSVVVLAFWSSWCAPCREVLASLDDLSEELGSSTVRFLALDAWDDPGVAPDAVLRDLGVDLPALLRAERIATDYKLTTLPALFVVDAQGDLAYVANSVDVGAAGLVADVTQVVRRLTEGEAR